MHPLRFSGLQWISHSAKITPIERIRLLSLKCISKREAPHHSARQVGCGQGLGDVSERAFQGSQDECAMAQTR